MMDVHLPMGEWTVGKGGSNGMTLVEHHSV